MNRTRVSECESRERLAYVAQSLPRLRFPFTLLHAVIIDSPATAARVDAFRKAKPNCQVDWSEKK